MKIPLMAAAAAALALTAPLSQATLISTAYKPIGTNTWLASFTITNDGTPASFAGFTIEFPDATNLALLASPSTWDSLVLQPDPSLPADGILDSFVINPANALAVGQSIGGFRVSFNYLAGATPGSLPFSINNSSFVPIFFGSTTVTSVPEPATVLSLALGLGFLGFVRARAPQRSADKGNA